LQLVYLIFGIYLIDAKEYIQILPFWPVSRMGDSIPLPDGDRSNKDGEFSGHDPNGDIDIPFDKDGHYQEGMVGIAGAERVIGVGSGGGDGLCCRGGDRGNRDVLF